MRNPNRILMAAAAMVVGLLLALPVNAQSGGKLKTVTYKDSSGQEITKVGEVTKDEKNQGYIILALVKNGVKMLEISIKESDVVSIVDYVSPAEDYLKRKAAIENEKDPVKHYDLASWANDNGLYKECVEQADIAISLRADYERAKIIKRQAEASLAAASKPPTTGGQTTGGTTTGQPTDTATPTPTPAPEAFQYPLKNLLDQQQMNRVMIEELRKDDTKVTIVFQNNIIDKFIQGPLSGESDAKKNEFRTLARTNPAAAVVWMRETTPRFGQVNTDVIIKGTPIFLQDFKANVMPVLKQAGSCADSACHGGGNFKGGFYLYSSGFMTDSLYLTNIVILSTFKDSKGRWMVSREMPANSLLLNFVLGAGQSQISHPMLPNVAAGTNVNLAAISAKDSPSYKKLYDWVDNLGKDSYSRSVVPDFGLGNWAPPLGMKLTQGKVGGDQASQPASVPASAPSDVK